MSINLKKAWTEIVTANDLDRHLLEAGQAEVNARLVCRSLKIFALPVDAKILMLGAGTGQILDYADKNLLSQYILTLTDINEDFLLQIRRRLAGIPSLRATVQRDDIEESRLTGSFDGIVAALLLEHIDWRRGIPAMIKLHPARIYLIVQRNEKESALVSRKRPLAPSIEEFAKKASPSLVSIEELNSFMGDIGYRLLEEYSESVPDGKAMVSLVFAPA
jgi:hypothetical protein